MERNRISGNALTDDARLTNEIKMIVEEVFVNCNRILGKSGNKPNVRTNMRRVNPRFVPREQENAQKKSPANFGGRG